MLLAKSRTRQDLLMRREQVSRLLDQLTEELEVIDEALTEIDMIRRPKLGPLFLENNIIPILRESVRGITTKGIVDELKEKGIFVDRSQISVLLSRAAARRQVIKVEKPGVRTRWKTEL